MPAWRRTLPSRGAGGSGDRSALDATRGDPFHEVALEEDVEDDNRQRGHDDDRHERWPVGLVEADELEEAERERPVPGCLEYDQRPEEAVPGALELEDRDRCQSRGREVQPPPPKRREKGGPVDSGRLPENTREG